MIESISIVIPAYNSASWLSVTVQHITAALVEASFTKRSAEIIIVDDGSSDDTTQIAQELDSAFPIIVITQENAGRFLARKNGVDAAKYDYIWFVDTRVHVDAQSLAYVLNEQRKDASAVVWNGHVNVHKTGNIIARFMDSITMIGWRRYFRRPRRCAYGLEEFDFYPKGTGCFLAPKAVLLSAMKAFMKQTTDLRNSSDDTLLIRLIAKDHHINLSPQFSCTYFARTTLKGFVKHTYNRGKFFVDGFLRPGTRFYRPLQAFLVLCVVGIVVIIAFPTLIIPLLIVSVLLWITEFVTALALRVPLKDSASLFVLSPLFAICYGVGIWSATLKLISRRMFAR